MYFQLYLFILVCCVVIETLLVGSPHHTLRDRYNHKRFNTINMYAIFTNIFGCASAVYSFTTTKGTAKGSIWLARDTNTPELRSDYLLSWAAKPKNEIDWCFKRTAATYWYIRYRTQKTNNSTFTNVLISIVDRRSLSLSCHLRIVAHSEFNLS